MVFSGIIVGFLRGDSKEETIKLVYEFDESELNDKKLLFNVRA